MRVPPVDYLVMYMYFITSIVLCLCLRPVPEAPPLMRPGAAAAGAPADAPAGTVWAGLRHSSGRSISPERDGPFCPERGAPVRTRTRGAEKEGVG